MLSGVKVTLPCYGAIDVACYDANRCGYAAGCEARLCLAVNVNLSEGCAPGSAFGP